MKKGVALLSVVRGYNILVIAIAQYLTSIYILSENRKHLDVILNPVIFLIVSSTSLLIASGYIINDFYDREKDIINKPNKTLLDSTVSKTKKLRAYFAFNTLALILASFVSWRAMLFVFFYGFIIWTYSHKIKKITFLGNFWASTLAVFPFFGIFLYYHNISITIILHALFLFLLILIREISKDLVNYRGDLIYDYKTIAVRYGVRSAKLVITFLIVATLIPLELLLNYGDIGKMDIYFYISFGVLLVLLIGMWRIKGLKWYLMQYNLIKLLIVLGVFSIILTSF